MYDLEAHQVKRSQGVSFLSVGKQVREWTRAALLTQTSFNATWGGYNYKDTLADQIS